MFNEDYYNPVFFKDDSHIKIGPQVIINELDSPYKSRIENGPIYVETPIAYWKIYKSPYRTKIVLDHSHKPDGKWHNQGSWGVFTNVPAAIHYIKKHDWEIKGCSKLDPLIISSFFVRTANFNINLSSEIYCLTCANEQLINKIFFDTMQLSYIQGSQDYLKSILNCNDNVIFNTRRLTVLHDVMEKVIEKAGQVDFIEEFKLLSIKKNKDNIYEVNEQLKLPDVSNKIRKHIINKLNHPWSKKRNNIFLLNTHSLPIQDKLEFAERISLSLGLTCSEAEAIVEQKSFFSNIMEESLDLLKKIGLHYNLDLKYKQFEYSEVYRKEKLNASRIEVIGMNPVKVSDKILEIKSYIKNELKLAKDIENKISEPSNYPLSLLITKGDQLEIKKVLTKYGFKVRLEKNSISKIIY
jgi:hypothetical protein